MLSKLMKYEIKATGRTFLPLYAALLIFAAINQLISFSDREWGTPRFIGMTLYVFIFASMCVMTLVVMIQRFYKNLLSDEGYLMFTLPTRPWMHIICKLLISMMWVVISGFVAMISIMIITIDQVSLPALFNELFKAVIDHYHEIGGRFFLIVLEALLWGILSLASSILIVYASIALGHLFNRHRRLAAFGSFLALTTVTQIIFIITGNTVFRQFRTENYSYLEGSMHGVVWFMIAFMGLMTAAYFYITNYILSKRLNLE